MTTAFDRWINKTHAGDCRQLLKTMIDDGVHVQTCVTSPPYFGLRDYGIEDGQIGFKSTLTEYVAQLVTVFDAVKEVLADDGTLWLNLGDSYSKGAESKNLLGIPWRVAFALQDAGWYLRSDIIWHKPNPMPESVSDRPTKSHEYVFMMSKKDQYFFDADNIAEPTQCDRVRGPALHGSSDTNGNSGLARRAVKETRNSRSVWTIPTESFKGAHFAPFPRNLAARCILAGSRIGDTILDVFMGSGTTGQVATSLGRQFIGCELNPDNIKMADDFRKTTIGLPF